MGNAAQFYKRKNVEWTKHKTTYMSVIRSNGQRCGQ